VPKKLQTTPENCAVSERILIYANTVYVCALDTMWIMILPAKMASVTHLCAYISIN